MAAVVKDYLEKLAEAGVLRKIERTSEVQENGTDDEYIGYDCSLASLGFDPSWVDISVQDFPFDTTATVAINTLKELDRHDVSSLLGCMNHAVKQLSQQYSTFHMNVLHASFQWLRWFAAGNEGTLPLIWSMV